MNRGEGFLTEEWTYPSALALGTPYGFSPVAVKADMQGMRGDDLDELLAKWDETSRGMKRSVLFRSVLRV
jgi:aromatic amino acid aminotransferase I / 2-aminoadipate transaminase